MVYIQWYCTSSKNIRISKDFSQTSKAVINFQNLKITTMPGLYSMHSHGKMGQCTLDDHITHLDTCFSPMWSFFRYCLIMYSTCISVYHQ